MYVTIHISNVPRVTYESYKSMQPLGHVVLYGLLPHEHKMSVMNVLLKRTQDSSIPIKSKERLIFQCGYRRFMVNPVFSQHTNSDKHKYERFFQPNATVVATFFAPIQFPPAPVLCFRENPNTSLTLVATGSLLSCTPDRVVLKRVALSGHPFKVCLFNFFESCKFNELSFRSIASSPPSVLCSTTKKTSTTSSPANFELKLVASDTLKSRWERMDT